MVDKKYSVLMSIYRKEKPNYFRASIESMRNQTLPPEEIVIVKDGPITMELDKVIDEYKLNDDRLFTIVELKENVGLGQALNVGLKKCRNELVARMDTDDISIEKRMDIQINHLINNPDIDILGGFAVDIDEEGVGAKSRQLPICHEKIEKLIWTNPIIHPTVVYRKSKIINIGSYDERIRRRQDYDLWFRAVAAGLKFENIPTALIKYRVTEDYFKKNGLKNQIAQFKIGLKGCKLVKANLIAYVGLLVPIVRGLLPNKIRKPLLVIFERLDPRRKIN